MFSFARLLLVLLVLGFVSLRVDALQASKVATSRTNTAVFVGKEKAQASSGTSNKTPNVKYVPILGKLDANEKVTPGRVARYMMFPWIFNSYEDTKPALKTIKVVVPEKREKAKQIKPTSSKSYTSDGIYMRGMEESKPTKEKKGWFG